MIPPPTARRAQKGRGRTREKGIQRRLPGGMLSACGRQWLLGLILAAGSSIKPSSAWFIPTAARSHVTHQQQRATAVTGRSSGSSIPTMRATPSHGDDGDTAGIPASMSRGEWLRVGASLAAMAPVFALGKENASMAATSSGTHQHLHVHACTPVTRSAAKRKRLLQ